MKLFFVISAWLAVACASEIPADIFNPKCPREGPGTVPCIIKGIKNFRPYLKYGMPKLNVPRMEPFKMRELNLDAEVPALVLKGDASNIVAYGASDYRVQQLRIDMKNYFMELTVFLPKLRVIADYDSTGSKLMGTDISGSGQFKATLTGITAVVRTYGHKVMRQGKEYTKLDDVTMEIKFADGTVQVDPDTRSVTAKKAAAFINENTGLIVNTMAPIINKASGPVLQKYLSKVFNTLPLSDIFRD